MFQQMLDYLADVDVRMNSLEKSNHLGIIIFYKASRMIRCCKFVGIENPYEIYKFTDKYLKKIK